MSTAPTVASKAGWKKNAKHSICLPSGTWVEIVVPDLARLIETDQIPQNLLDAALKAAGRGGDGQMTKEAIIQEREFTDKLVQITVVTPALTTEDLHEIPYEDKVMLVEISTRQRDLDAEGNHIGGLHTSERWRRFRGFEPVESALADF